MSLLVTVWADDCVVRGTLRGEVVERLTDLVNAEGRIELEGVRVAALEEPREFEIDGVTLGLDDLCLVELVGPRGPADRRRVTVRHRVEAEVGPYRVTGTLHSLPGSGPLTTFRRRPPLVPLTEVVVELRGEAGVRGLRWEVAAAGVNQARIEAIAEVPADASGEEGWVGREA